MGEGRGLHDCLRLPRLLTTNTRQLEILVTTLVGLFTVAAGDEARVDSVLMQPFLLYYVNHGIFVLTIIIMRTFLEKSRDVCINTSSPPSSHSIKS